MGSLGGGVIPHGGLTLKILGVQQPLRVHKGARMLQDIPHAMSKRA